MSEMTLITKRYDDLVGFTSKVNKSIIVFKKKSLLGDARNKTKYPNIEISEEDLSLAKENLLQSLDELESLAKNTQYSSKLSGLSESSTLQKMVLRSDTDQREIENIIQNLKSNQPLSKTHFIVLDKIIAILDSERNLLFRKLRTARG